MVLYLNDHGPRHVHVFKDGEQLDRYDLERDRFMDGTIGKHAPRVRVVLRAIGLID